MNKSSIFLQNSRSKNNLLSSKNPSMNEFKDFSNSAISTTILAGSSPL